MTKPRAPLSIDAALARIAGHLPGGFDDMAQVAGRAVRTVRNWSDPDTAEQIPLDCAIALDLAYMAAGGECAPLFETYAFKLELAQMEHFACNIRLARHTADVIREGGEAHSALVRATLPGASAADRRIALQETTEAIDFLKRVVPLLASPNGDEPGGNTKRDPVADQHHPP
ncbi:hypothetical protein [Blastomonas sp.]|uniref:hypothetical protein n=1 Tax=Blastomonas sp. TaxID=1909299 RepID=UPI00391B7DC2